ncbi:zinc finger-containing ubiquitin peptidase 1-like isoform X2 [Montipora foliosa]|uniref:zinc finger-containing ubiquitin peptidase 1-like isoform X2 n=1 Tax=Montipora foliosa TaxID=591990 RepID=UPI0035F1EEB6
MKRRRDELYRHDIDFPPSMSICPVCGTSVPKEDIGIHVEDHFTQPSAPDESNGFGDLEVPGISSSPEFRSCTYGKCQQMDDHTKQPCLEGQSLVTGTEFIPFSSSDWDDHIFGHTLEDEAITSSTTGNNLLTTVTYQQQQQEQYDVPLIYSHNDQALAQELEKQEMERLENQPCEWDDHMLAQALESEQRREFEEQRHHEEEEFKKLQAMYGMSSTSGYATQYSRQLERDVTRNKTSVGDYYARKAEMLKILMTDNDSGESCTRGIIAQLHHRYEMGVSGTKAAWLAIDTDHYASTVGDAGWGCGYRNLQMLISSLLKMDIYRPVMLNFGEKVPSIPRIQQFIEAAWSNGFDRQGAEQLGCKLINTRKWIGATEIAALFRSLQIRAKIIDFHQATGCDGTHPEMFSWIKRYFSCSVNSTVLPMGSSVLRQTSVPPLYLQHQGHSRLVVGVEEHSGKDGGLYLLLFDPSHSAKQMHSLLEDIQSSSSGLRHLRRSLKQMRCKQYQIVYVDGIMEPSEMEQGKVLDSMRVP